MQYSYKKRYNFVMEITRLSIWYAHRKSSNSATFIEILSKTTPIYRLTTLWDGVQHPAKQDFDWQGSKWSSICNSLSTFYRHHKVDIAVIENYALKLLTPYLEARIEKDINAWPWLPCGYVPYNLPDNCIFGVFAIEPPDDNATNMPFHIANTYMPESPFKQLPILINDLSNMLSAIRQRFPKIKKVYCNSWLNSFPPFLKLFPASYPEKNTANICNIGYGYNWWGQFMARDGSFHEKNGEKMRQDGNFPSCARNGICSLGELEFHIITRLG